MPNWVTNVLKSTPRVIRAITNDNGEVDFDLITRFPGKHVLSMINFDAECAVERTMITPTYDATELSSSSYEQYTKMLENYHQCGYLHQMDFARRVWGTKWNAFDSHVNIGDGTATFDTAWNNPEKVLILLSEQFPNDLIHVEYADEDIGNNCGTYILRGGAIVTSNIAQYYMDQSDDQREYWTKFACEIKGWDPADYQ